MAMGARHEGHEDFLPQKSQSSQKRIALETVVLAIAKQT